MSDVPAPFGRAPTSKSRGAWWLVVAALAATVALFVYSFVGTFVFGLFVYYGVRPLHHRLARRVDSRSLSSTATMLLVVLPVLALLAYAAATAVQELATLGGPGLIDALADRLPLPADSLSALARRPDETFSRLTDVDLANLQRSVEAGLQTLGVVGTGLLHLTLALTFAFFLLRDGSRLANWFRADVRDEESVAHAYLTAVDADLETVYFGNVITVLLVTVGAVVVYNGFSLAAPSPVRLPAPTLLAILTGLATFVPIVVGKIIYAPATLFLAWAAVDAESNLLWVPALFFVTSFLFLDVLPQTVIRPLVSGRSLHSGLVLFAYVLGAALFGWYGLFLGPLLAVLVVQGANIVLPELVSGEPLTPSPSAALDIGSAPTQPAVDNIDDADVGDESSDGASADADDDEGA